MKKFLSTIICFAMLFLVMANTSTVAYAQEAESNVEALQTSDDVINANANDDGSNDSFYHCFSSENTVRLTVDSDYYPAETEIDLVINTSLSAEIENMEFTAEGFSLTNDFQTVGNEIYFSVLHISEYENPHLMINFDLVDAPDMYVQLFGVVREGMLFVNQYGYQFAEQAYEYRFGSSTNTSMAATAELMEDVALQTDNNSVQTTSSATPDTTIQGRLLLREGTNDPYPVRFCKITFYECDPNLMNNMGSIYTDENGYFTFSFVNEIDDENGIGSDIYMEIHTSSPDVTVEGPYTVYLKAISFVDNSMLKDMSIGTHILEDIEFSIDYESTEEDFFDQAMKLMQAATYASFYYEAMKGEDVEDVTIIFPSSGDARYMPLTKFIYIPGNTSDDPSYVEGYESWDVITHEYGHHVSCEENWIDSPGRGHYSFEDMAEHYKSHFLDDGFSCDIDCAKKSGLISESQCKREGMQLAWGEGYATFFGIIAQRYCQELWFERNSAGFYTHRIFTFGDVIYSSGSGGRSIDGFESESDATGQNCEELVSCILFEMHSDTANPNVGDLALGDRTMWNIMKSCKAKTLYEFTNYFDNNYAKNYTSKLGEILHRNYQATSAPRIREQNGVVEFHFDWEDLNSDGYFNARKFQINFYDEQYNLITSTEPDTAPLDFEYIDASLWSSILNNRNLVYVSITTHEYDGNISNTESDGYITHYESALTEFINPSIATEIYYNTQPSVTLNSDEVAWYKFTAPDTTTYTFSTIGGESAYWELFGFTVPKDSKYNLLASSNQLNSHTYILNSAITYDLEAGETVYIRICGVNYGSLNNTVLKIEHVCTYNSFYAKYSSTQHKATCFCGNTRYESHSFVTYLSNIKCQNCGYITSGPGAIVKPFSSESGIDSVDYVCYNMDEDKKY